MKLLEYTIVLTLLGGLLSNCSTTDERSDSLVIAFGSCNEQDHPQPMWDEVLAQNPDVWVWLGDNIYGDSHDPEVLREKYRLQNTNEDYQKLVSSAKVYATWDDHDYGVNDGGKHYPHKEESQQAFLEFIDAEENDPRWERAGIYSSELIQADDLTVKLILLDARYFRDTVMRSEQGYLANDTGTVLGRAQWDWLEKELSGSAADVHIIGSGIQVLAEDHRFEKWANFPQERARLLSLINESKATGVIFISGDRHIAEVSEVNIEGVNYAVRDVTSSGLTHSYEGVGDEPNRHRVSPLIGMKNFGVFTITKEANEIRVALQLRGLSDTVFYQQKWSY